MTTSSNSGLLEYLLLRPYYSYALILELVLTPANRINLWPFQ